MNAVVEPQLAGIGSEPSSFVVKVDQGVKGRFKKGLVLLDVKSGELANACAALSQKGYRWIVIEPTFSHKSSDEQYISLAQERNGIVLTYSSSGGVDVELHPENMHSQLIAKQRDLKPLAGKTGFTIEQLHTLLHIFEAAHIAFLEINPYVISSDTVHILDAAIEVDDVGSFFTDAWTPYDIRDYNSKQLTPQEEAVLALAEKSPASFKLNAMNPDGSIFLLLSGGGASIVVAEEIYNQGLGEKLANYGEYSGNPNAEETAVYAQAVIELLLASDASPKVLFIGGAVANFTDIAKTFAGIIDALTLFSKELKAQKVKVFIRRGGPNQEAGLTAIQQFLSDQGLLGAVHDSTTPISEAVKEALECLR
jgi:ATP-citrate lyase beta-subunit